MVAAEPASVCVCPSVCSYFQTSISLRPAGGLRSNFILSIIWMGESLYKVLVQIASELWFPWQQIAPIGFIMGKMVLPHFLGCFWLDLFYTCR